MVSTLESYKVEGLGIIAEGYDPQKAEQAKKAKQEADAPYWRIAIESRQNGTVLKSTVIGLEKRVYKDGVEAEWCAIVDLGTVTGYIPLSMLESTEKTMRGLVGQEVWFVVIAINNENGYFVGSRKEAIRKMSDRTLKQLKIGDKVIGVIRQVFDANLLVDVGGITTSIPVKEISYSWIDNLNNHYEIGEHIDVQITGINREKRTVDASIKALLPDPFEKGIEKFQTGGEYVGVVSGVAKFGYHINLADGISGLAQLKNMAYERGEKVLVRVGKIDKDERKIFLRIVKKL